ncbi:hypothetical protein Cgig2_018699 [Carnegiea gigantea]|uniref:Uncharacterized protein n=1 Tax=Carnegiea gigantea TaxID=171969 RepID=A0A9Q1QHJ0_9CARY|nr:hypothetical protein Cgig2_018699 [Carnegiea gigantea]
MAPLEPKPPDLCHRAGSFTYWGPFSSRSKPSHKYSEPDALEFRNKHSSQVIGTRIEFSEPLDEGYYELDMTLRVGSGGQKLGSHCIDRRLATLIARSGSPSTRKFWVFNFRLASAREAHRSRHYASYLLYVGMSKAEVKFLSKAHNPDMMFMLETMLITLAV